MSNYEKTVAWWQNRRITTEADLALAFTGHEVSFAYHSGKIENDQITFHDTREIFDHDGVTDYTGDLRTLFEIRNAKDANSLFLSSFGSRHPFDETLLLAFHLELEVLKSFLKKQTVKTWEKQRAARRPNVTLNSFL